MILKNKKFDSRVTKIIKGKTSEDDIKAILLDVALALYWDKNTLFLIEGGHSDSPERTKRSNEAIHNLVKNLRYRNEHEIPKEAGQCIYQGFIKDQTKQYRYSIQTACF